MGFKDISSELNEVAQQYHFHKAPAFVENLKEWMGHLVRLINEVLRTLFSHGGGSLDSRQISQLMQFATYFAGVAAMLGVVYLLIKKAGAARQENAEAVRGATLTEEILDAAGWKSRARTLADTKDYRGACRALYLALLKRLDENGIAEFAPTKTNYEYAYALVSHPELQRGFKQLAELVEVIWFGNKNAESDDYTASLQTFDDLDTKVVQLAESKKAVGGGAHEH